MKLGSLSPWLLLAFGLICLALAVVELSIRTDLLGAFISLPFFLLGAGAIWQFINKMRRKRDES